LATATLLALGTGCLEVERVVCTIDARAMTAEILYVGLSSDSHESVEEDYTELIEHYVKGAELESNYPNWAIQSKQLLEQDGQLVGRVQLEVSALADLGVYKHDRRSPYILCETGDPVTHTNGTEIGDILSGCVVWERSQRRLQVAFGDGLPKGAVSLLDRWKLDQQH
jgi:hypothetical protein